MGGLDCYDRRPSSGLYCLSTHGCPRHDPHALRHGDLAAGRDQIDRADLGLTGLGLPGLGLTGLGLTGLDLTGLAAELALFCPECGLTGLAAECGLAFQWRY